MGAALTAQPFPRSTPAFHRHPGADNQCDHYNDYRHDQHHDNLYYYYHDGIDHISR